MDPMSSSGSLPAMAAALPTLCRGEKALDALDELIALCQANPPDGYPLEVGFRCGIEALIGATLGYGRAGEAFGSIFIERLKHDATRHRPPMP